MDRFVAIEAFVRVAETRSFSEAARQMRVARSVVTARIQQLEQFVGAPLFLRNTRSVRLSDLGNSFLRDCSELVGRTNEVVDQMREVSVSPVGRLRVHALTGFVLGHLAALLREFQARYPQIVLDVVVNDAPVDPVKEGFDCTLQIFPPRSEELISKKLFPVRRVFCATPQYLEAHGRPARPRDLLAHPLGWYSGYPTRERISFHGGKQPITLELKPALLTNSVHLLREYAAEHAGIVCVPTLVAARAIADGALEIVLPEFPLSAFWLNVFYPVSARNALKLKLFLDLLDAGYAGKAPWDAALVKKGLLPTKVIDA
jgi:DNA-binding transcriptional LysR family regulator